MIRWQPLWQLFLARVREFYREPEAIFWVYGFPIILAVGLGVAFSGRKSNPPEVDIQSGGDEVSATERDVLFKYLHEKELPVELHDAGDCHERLRTGKTALYVIPRASEYVYVYDEKREDAVRARYQIDDLVQHMKANEHAWKTEDETVKEVGARYIDFLVPGLMGMNLMGGGLFGVGFVLVDMRVRKLMKRLLATPMRRGDFLLSVLVARLVFLLPEMALLVLVGWLVFDVPMRGGVMPLLVIILIGAAAFSGIGLLIACRTDKLETVSGLINLVMLPMWLLSGVFFSSKRFPAAVQPFIQALPLTQLNDALRATMLEGTSLAGLIWPLTQLVLWAVITFVLALRWFRWQ